MYSNNIIIQHVFRCYVNTQIHTCVTHIAQMITRPPESTAAALDTNATFSCHGTGSVLWQINGTQVQDASQLPSFENVLVFVPLPRPSSSELIVTATEVTNATLVIVCAVDPGIGRGDIVMSEPVQLLVYGMSAPSLY